MSLQRTVIAARGSKHIVRKGSYEILELALQDDAVLSPGWYRVSGSVSRSRQPTSYALTTRSANGAFDLGTLMLNRAGDVAQDVVCRLPGPAQALELKIWRPAGDPTASFDQVALRFEQIGRFEALASILRTLRHARHERDGVALGSLLRSVLIPRRSAGLASRLDDTYRTVQRIRQFAVLADNMPVPGLDLRRGPGMHAEVLGLFPGVADAPIGMPLGHQEEVDELRISLPSQVLGPPLAPGWYRVRAQLTGMDAQAAYPVLYPDHGAGEGMSAGHYLGRPDRKGRVDSMILLPYPVFALSLVPSVRHAHVGVKRMRLERMGRVGALSRALTELTAADAGGVSVAWQSLRRFLANWRSVGLSQAAQILYRHYRRTTVGDDTSYAQWVSRYDTIEEHHLPALRAQATAIPARPLISIVIPTYNTPERWLRRCLDSVLEQTYEDWELCVADDASPAPHVRTILDEYAAREPRMKLVHRKTNGHISAASNSALALCTGAYVGLLDHDDELRPHALLEVALAISANPDLRIVYSDEDKLDEEGRRFDPYFKPDWDPDLLRSQNYVCHFLVVSTELARSVGGFRQGYEGSQDHDLLLRCSEHISAQQVHHIPKVLYHWRAIEGSTALARDAKDYAAIAGAKAVRDHLERLGADASVEELPHGHYRVRWSPGTPCPKVSLVIPTRDRVSLLRTCVASILERTDYPDYEIVIVDNRSEEPETMAYFEEISVNPRVRVLRYDADFNYSAINNWAVAQTDGALVGLLNNDLEVISSDWLTEMTSLAHRTGIGAVGAMLYYPDDRIQHAGVILGIGGVANHAYVGLPRGYPGHGGRAKVVQQLSAVTAACLLVSRVAYDAVGGLDEELAVAFNDVDLCLRLGAHGYRNMWTPFAELYHHESASRGTENTPEKYERFRSEVRLMESRWGHLLKADPAYNPNLTLRSTDFGYAFPPRRPCREN